MIRYIFLFFCLSVSFIISARDVDTTALKGILPVTDPSCIKSLNGKWNLKVIKGIDDNPKVPELDNQWGEIPVPGCWEAYGYCEPSYSMPDSLTGYYRMSFTVPKEWKGNQVVIRLDGVFRGYDLWLNNHWVGTWEQAYNTCLMDLTPHLSKNAFKGEPQELAMRVYSRHKGFEFDCYDDWAPMGIHRNVSIMKIPRTHLADLTVLTNDRGMVEVKPVINNAGKHTKIEIELKDCDGRIVANGENMKVDNPNLWTAETPYLYTLGITLKERDNILQRYEKKIGLRTLSVINGNVLTVNGSPVKFRGVTCHATDPRTVKVIDDTLTLKDMKLMKEASINYIRTSHYPREPRFYELADSLGFYVINEVPFGSRGEKHLSKPDYYKILQSRAHSTISRDKNNTCVLIWSLGNENPLPESCCRLGEYVKSIDPTRMICYPQKGSYFRRIGFEKFPAVADIYTPHYPTTSLLRSYFRNPDRPVIFTEYCHTLGISFEDHDRQWEIIENNPGLAGGSVWEWADQGMPFTAPLKSRFGYEERVFTSDNGGFEMYGNKGTDGLLYADRTPLPNYYELQRNYAVIDVLDTMFNGALTIRNRHDFANLKDNSRICWSLINNYDTICGGSFSVDCPPHAQVTHPLALPTLTDTLGISYLSLDFFSHQGYKILTRHLPIKINREKIKSMVVNYSSDAELFPMVRTGRKPTMAENIKVADLRISKYIQPLENPYIKVSMAKKGKEISCSFIADTTKRLLSEIGLAFLLSPNIDRVQWIGNGPYAAYPGRNRSVNFGRWSMHCDDLYFEGNRSGVEAMWLSDKNGEGIMLYCGGGNVTLEQTDRGILVSINAAVSGQGPKFSPTAFGVWSNKIEPVECRFSIGYTYAGHPNPLFRHPSEIKPAYRPFLTQYDTYLMTFDAISEESLHEKALFIKGVR